MICAVISDESGPAEKTAGTVSRFWLRWTSSEDVMSMVECVVVPTSSLTLAVGILKKRLFSLYTAVPPAVCNRRTSRASDEESETMMKRTKSEVRSESARGGEIRGEDGRVERRSRSPGE